ncbi:MAG: adenylosuccinate synthetase, partial [Planctomycetes bacterium]|nr:adenylosuccinate synthetase [Planctomycetota bacterium]
YEAEPMDVDMIIAEYSEYGRRLAPMVTDTGHMLRLATAQGKRVLFEGSQGSLLDVDHGTFPFVTSSSVTAGGVPAGSGVAPGDVGEVVGLIKAYTTRVGAGPFATEQDNATGEYLRRRGHEYGTTTGRPRRCGWFDAFAVKYAADISGVDEFALSLLDVLSGLDEIKVCTGYRVAGKDMESFDPTAMSKVECVYRSFQGWTGEIDTCERFADLPDAAQAYVIGLEELLGRPVGVIGVGPGREQSITHNTRIPGLG